MYLKGACKDKAPHFRGCDAATRSQPAWEIPNTALGSALTQCFAERLELGSESGLRFILSRQPRTGRTADPHPVRRSRARCNCQRLLQGGDLSPLAGAASNTDFGTFWREQVSALIWRCNSLDRSLRAAAGFRGDVGSDHRLLERQNREYAEGEADYNWSTWADNCSHTMRNALAAANIWSPLSVRAIKIRQILSLAVSRRTNSSISPN